MPVNQLHNLHSTNPNVEEVQALIDKYPDALKEKDDYGSLPLHYAVDNGASVEVINLLIEEYPDALKEKNKNGSLPLHYSIKYRASVEVIQLLVKEFPDALKEKEKGGNLPLHFAIRYGMPDEVIQLLIKEYPDAVKEKDGNDRNPLDNPQIKEIYDRVISVAKNSMRSKVLLGDHAEGKDLLGVKEEAHAIADTIAFKDLQPPFVVGILGGWGKGKSFTFNLIKEHLREIQKYNLATEVVELDFPYVGHIYLIKFDVWTFAKDCLLSSLMNRILTELNDQLDLESAIGPELLREGVSLIELMDQFTTSGEFEYLKEVVKDENVQNELREWKPRGGNITKALVNAINSNYDNEMEDLAKKKQELEIFTKEFETQKEKKKQKLAWDDVTAVVNTTFLPEIKKLVKDAYKQYAEENPSDPVPQTVDAAMNSIKQWKGCCGRAVKCWDLLRAGRLSPLWLTVFLSSLILAVVLPVFLKSFESIVIVFGPFISGISGIFLKFNDAREKLRIAQAEITKVASEMNLDKEQLQEAMEAATEVHLRSDANDEEKQQDIIKVLNAEINSLEDRIWLREGDSLKKVVRDRVGSNNYEKHLGVVHLAQADLQHISDALLRRDDNEKDAAKKIFPRGDPRIVLFIDDLDRCPPDKVVETLEAVQLLVKTKLFVVVLAIDAQYVTFCLEKKYEGILSQERHPSGLDYVEKIVQLPYRVPPISAKYMRSYLQEQMNAKKEEADDTPAPVNAPLFSEIGTGEDTSDEEMPKVETAQSEPDSSESEESYIGAEDSVIEAARSDSKAVLLPTEELDFTWEEYEYLEKACVFSGVDPRSSKRLVNVFKVIKDIWHRRDQTPEVSMKEAYLLILALCASNSKRLRRQMCKVLANIERASSMPTDCDNLKDFIEKALGEMGAGQVDGTRSTIKSEICIEIFEKVKWNDDEEWDLVKNDLRLLRSFSFIGEYNESVEDIHRGL